MTQQVRANLEYSARVPWNQVPALAIELLARQVYFRSSWLRGFTSKKAPAEQRMSHKALMAALSALPSSADDIVMVHSGTRGIVWVEGEMEIQGSMKLVLRILDTLRTWVGPMRTLAMPTHPWYAEDVGYHEGGDKSNLILTYDPGRTPSSVGLISEAFRRTKGVVRSWHPLQSVSAIGPRAQWLVGDQVLSGALPHGPDSPYGRLCEADALVMSIGVSLVDCFTVIHAAEDARDSSWPVRDFYRQRHFHIIGPNGELRELAVRERRPHFARAYAKGQLRRDLVRERILNSVHVDGMRIDWLRAGALFDYLMMRNRTTSYPYFFTQLAAVG